MGEINTKEYYKNLYNELLNKKEKSTTKFTVIQINDVFNEMNMPTEYIDKCTKRQLIDNIVNSNLVVKEKRDCGITYTIEIVVPEK